MKKLIKLKDVKWLAQGTIYPDCIESLSITGTVIKSHHNVGGLPEKMRLKLMRASASAIQEMRYRHVGRELGMPEHLRLHAIHSPDSDLRYVFWVISLLRKYVFCKTPMISISKD